MKILQGKPVAEKIENWCIAEVKRLKEEKNAVPHLRVLQYGDDAASKAYVGRIEKNCKKAGIKFEYKVFTDDKQAFVNSLKDANESDEITSIMVQQPLPDSLKDTIEMINPKKDIEGITSASLGKLFVGLDTLIPCTAEACMEIIDFYDIPLKGERAVVVGRSNIVGKPVSILLQQRHATVTMCHSRTRDLNWELKHADIVVAAVGRPEMITGDMLGENTVVIDVGTNFVDGKLLGDVDYESASKKAEMITPVPGGVGTVTNQVLIRNIVKSFKNLYE
ncbi:MULTISPECIES: bifunctional 5,10-methylenetetrahydrofolate dehydrogenase/5,10-methenyltetrahydrofolate cyclohydrolase [unclassified Halanaerobium]|uniref:bifunctional 5,10-methylenetetrahydrofolate dehydrogenase/5,10-methenyltetrahydrofolate cyclohydrolase n=1 Tax=unclassified Halanaerobium TaxID=2641197 RepID=UPI000DF3829E|nr:MULTISPECIES: bifunctional 5,10-methylenetetrahydrofolate dehydrogenase/5,10-methenyltetrahydrofolate cyclohydrolase [unclassified Halanaerobium]RCW43767.1 methylenetetrahydrofolate dehydrogenase (NADP+)/methenyltetrahydrofolate cyclohydrolase [Halanaerobium sp. MA284_MarDTE_T2]RCW89164.1 methylenetetrahydrofolate dehydrogenase (NADP+)/methenyltetrahydrofolate cyclohydrolase [Halanaerobium sp. DL-01]